MYFHAGSHNHGCEAIVRTTWRMLSEAIGKEFECIVSSNVPHEDYKYIQNGLPIDFFKGYKPVAGSEKLTIFLNRIENRILNRSFLGRIQYSRLIRAAKGVDIAVSIGGDNYSETAANQFCVTDREILKRSKKSILMGCSMDERYLDIKKNKKKIKSLKQFSLIEARESLTYDALKKCGLTNIKLRPDPAFSLPVNKNIISPFHEKKAIGINLSPLLAQFENIKGMAYKNYIHLIKYLLKYTEDDIVLIPHVVYSKENSDYEMSKKIKKACGNDNRIILISDDNCIALKTHISRCRLFICARTHASIAAYSTCVPTLVLGYSVKSRGIAKDLFGTFDNYVIDVKDLKTKNDLIYAYRWLEANNEKICRHLKKIMPEYIKKTELIIEDIRGLINEK